MRRIIVTVACVILFSGCRIVSYTTTIENVTRSTITSETVQEQAAPKTLGDIAPKTSITP